MTAEVGGYLLRLAIFVLFLVFLMEYIDVFIDWLFSVLTFQFPKRRRAK